MTIEFVVFNGIKEKICIEILEYIYNKMQNDARVAFTGYPCKYILKDLHIGSVRFQKILDCINRNNVYFKWKYGYTIQAFNIVMTVDGSKRYKFGDNWAFFLKVNKINHCKSDI